MLVNRRGRLRSGFHDVAKSLTLVLIINTCVSDCFAAAARTGSVSLTEAGEQGTFNVGPAEAELARSFEPAVGGDVLRLKYTIPAGSTVGLFAKAFREKPEPGRPTLVSLGIGPDDPARVGQVEVWVEIKGKTGAQRIGLEIPPRWTTVERLLDWGAVGELDEVVFVVRPLAGATATGSLRIDARFEELSFARGLSLSFWARLAGVAIVGLFVGAVVALAGAVVGRAGGGEQSTAPRGLGGDLIRGVGWAFIAFLVVATYRQGARDALEAGWSVLGLAVAGAIVGGWWKLGLTGKLPTPREAFQHALAGGLLAVSSSSMTLLQAPAQWSQTLLISQTAAAVALLIYFLADVSRLSSTGRSLGAAGAVLIVSAPYVLGGLTLLEPDGLLRSLGGLLTANTWASAFVARVLVVFLFNAAVSNLLSWVVRGGPWRSWRAHLTMLAVAVAAVAAPWIAGLGAGPSVASWSILQRLPVALLATIFSQAGLWAEAYLFTGLAMDAVRGLAPSRESILAHPLQGLKKGMIYSGTFMGILYTLGALHENATIRRVALEHPLLATMIFGGLAFPLLKAIFESFDGSPPFIERVARSYRKPTLVLRGAVAGLGLSWGLTAGLPARELSARMGFGFLVGAAAYAGIDLTRDAFATIRDRGRLQAVRYYAVHAVLGGLIGAAIGFYLDSAQLAVVVAKFQRYVSAGRPPEAFGIYPLVSKWGFLNLGTVSGGVDLLFAEALAGAISWSTAAWLFALNRTFMTACFESQSAPVRLMFTKAGMIQLTENMIQVMRWGLWMSPIINSFLRPMGEPTWYNQDGAVRTVLAVFKDATSTPDAFRAWSLQVFIYLLAYDAVRILIWMDHMGLRVATLVNLSFLGVDAFERRLSRYLAPAATARSIPEAVKRFTTWGPLLLPFYIPRGADWDHAWSAAEALRGRSGPGVLEWALALPVGEQALLAVAAAAACAAVCTAVRLLGKFVKIPEPAALALRNQTYELMIRNDGAVIGRIPSRDQDVSRRSYDLIDPAGRAIFVIVDSEVEGDEPSRAWPLIGNLPGVFDDPAPWVRRGDSLTRPSSRGDVRAVVEVALPAANDPVELWTITLENLSDRPRSVKVVPYLEWVLNRPEADRGHTQYNRLFAEIEYVGGLRAVLAWDKHAKAMGLLAADLQPEGFLSSRIDFIGRARSLSSPRVLQTLAFTEPRDTAAHPTLDPIGSLLTGLTLPARGSSKARFLIGLADDKKEAVDLIARHLETPGARAVSEHRTRKETHRIGHGEIPPGTPQPYAEFSDDGTKLLVRTPLTPRPFDHTMSNRLGHVVVVTNRGLHTSASVNAQQNRLTPDWSDIVTREVPSEAIYLFDAETGAWFSPTYHPVNDPEARHEAEFGVDGTAVFRMNRGNLETELTVFAPVDNPTGVYLLTIKNHGRTPRRLRVAPYFQMVLAGQPEYAGRLSIDVDERLNAVFFENPRNTFRTGPAFVAMSENAERIETVRGRFIGAGRNIGRPHFVEHAEADAREPLDDRPVAAFVTSLEIPAQSDRTVVVILGQADDRRAAEAVVRKYQDVKDAEDALAETRRWWLGLSSTVQVETAAPEFDGYLDWLKYQALAVRIWARRGFYQASGAYGFRDQLQDSVNLIWVDPAIARRQILLHASQQFLEGDVVHWFHRLQDGRTGFVGRSHASDNLLWLCWAVVEYLGTTGDESILDERTYYLESEQPFEPLPAGKQGMGFDPIRSTRDDTVYRHCLRAIDLVLDRRMGAHQLPLIGTGDWNDGLDEIGSEGRGESVWLGFFLSYILGRITAVVEKKERAARRDYYEGRRRALNEAIERTWRGDRYLCAIHDDGTEIGVKGSGVWEIDALTAAWAVMSGVNPDRGRIVFETALKILERENTILLGWPPLREDTKPYLGRSSWYPEGVRENGMYCHGVQWLVGAARILAEQRRRQGDAEQASAYVETAYRLWRKIASLSHATTGEIEVFGGQPNQQAAAMVTTFDPGRMIWNGYTGAAGWMLRQALEGVLGLRLSSGAIVDPSEPDAPADLGAVQVVRDLARSPFLGDPAAGEARDTTPSEARTRS
ncbi:GH94 family glycosyltransferase (phosphorylase) (plasmid) [Paludisphaera borealis]|uniref:GH94 family glycosyltransferase (Phosphorylase) n=1 Tax=Paludisphaera borealis TaxID=1387353 RepID=A0A1U7CZD2_9BACT|nr:GH94 family glycosyltransferase (phosphorylase) [Paludisphaera borealis]